MIFSEAHSRPWRVRPEDAVDAVLALAGSVAFLETLEWTVGRNEAEGLADVRCPGHIPMPDDPALVARTILEFTRRPGPPPWR